MKDISKRTCYIWAAIIFIVWLFMFAVYMGQY